MRIDIAIRQDSSGKWFMWHVRELIVDKFDKCLESKHTSVKDHTPENTVTHWLQQYLDEH